MAVALHAGVSISTEGSALREPECVACEQMRMFALRMIRSRRQALRARSLIYPNEGLLTSKTVGSA